MMAKSLGGDQPRRRLEQLTKLLSRISDASHKRNNITHGLWNREEGKPGDPITRMPLKRDYQKGAALAYTKKDLTRIRDEFIALERDLYAFAEPRWTRSMEKRAKLKANKGAFVPHHFQFKIDGTKRIKAVVDTDGVKVFELPPRRPKGRG